MSGGDNSKKQQAIERVETFYRALLASREIERKALEEFAKVCKEVHEYLTDEFISEITIGIDKKGYSRARIQQLRCGKITKK